MKRTMDSKRTDNKKQSLMLENFFVKTTVEQKEILDRQLARMVYATNSPFHMINQPEFEKLIYMLRPSYKPPNVKLLGREALNHTYEDLRKTMKESLRGKCVCMIIYGWSNVFKEPMVCISVFDVLEKEFHLIDCVDTADTIHAADYILISITNAITECKTFGCDVKSIVVDNVSNVNNIRAHLALCEELADSKPDIVTYGCSTQIINLLVRELRKRITESNVTAVCKYFRKNNFAGKKYYMAGGKPLNLPSKDNLSTIVDMLEDFVENWHILSKICTDFKTDIEVEIVANVLDKQLKITAEGYLKQLRRITVALDIAQRDSTTIGDITEIWLKLMKAMANEPNAVKEKCQKHFQMTMTPAHFMGNLLDPRYRGQYFDKHQMDETMEYISTNHADIVPEVIKYQAFTSPFRPFLFEETSLQNVTPMTWWRALYNSKSISVQIMSVAAQLYSTVASTTGIENIFSDFGFVYSDVRNRLGVEKATRLVSIYQELNKSSKNE